MKPRTSIFTILTTLIATASSWAAPSEIARLSFEPSGDTMTFTTSVPQFIELATSPLTDYFSVIPNNGTKVGGNRTIAGGDGANVFAAEDCDSPRTLPAVAGPQEVSLTTNAVNIAGKINTQVRLLMAAPGRDATSLLEYENFSNSPLFINKLRVEASIDGGAFQRVVQFSPTLVDVGAQPLTFDVDGNNVGGDVNPIPTNPTTLDATLREGIYSIPTGNTVAIKVTLESDATGELIMFDNIRVFGESAATNPPALAGVPAPNLIFVEGGSAAAIAPALTVVDTDSANLASASVVLSQALVSSEDVLAASPSGAILAGDIAYTAATGTLTITRSASLANYQAVLRSVTYQNTNIVSPSTSVRRVTFLANDGVNPSNAPIRDINVVDNIVTQSIPFVESFETDGRGTRYLVDGGFSSPPSMFARTQPGAVSGIDGTFAFGVENVDDNPDFTELVTFNLNAAALANLTGELRVAAGGGLVYDNTDFLRVEVSADGGAFQNVLAFYGDVALQGNMRQDTTPGDGSNVGDGTVLTTALQTFSFALPNATTLVVRIRAFTNIVGENILFDRLSIQGTALSAPTIIAATQADITTNSATLGGNVTSDGGTPILARGVVFAKTSDDSTPNIGEPNVSNFANGTNTTGIFTIGATGLQPGTAYTFAAYATNSVSTSYTGFASFTTEAAPVTDPTITVLGSKGGAVPGAGVSGSGIPADAVWAKFGVPSVNNAGQAAVLGSFKSESGSTTAILSFNVADTSTMKVVAKKGDPAPGITDAVIGSIREPLLGRDGSIAWIASLANAKGTTGAVLSSDNSAIFFDADAAGANPAIIIARKGAVAAGAAPAVSIPVGVEADPEWSAFNSVVLGESAVVFTASLAKKTPGIADAPGPGGVTSATDKGLWIYNRGTTETTLALREGNPFGDSTIKSIAAIVARPGSPGQGHGIDGSPTEYVLARVTLVNKVRTIGYFGMNGTSDFLYTVEGDAPDYGAGAKWKSLGIPTQNSTIAAMAFLGTVEALTGTATSANNMAIFAEDDGYVLGKVVAKGDAAGVSGGVFSALKDPVNASDRAVAFLGSMKPNDAADITSANNDGLWYSHPVNGLTLIAREGAQPPEAPTGAQWKKIKSIALPEGRGPIFVATMHRKTGDSEPGPGGITAANDTGLWATDSTGVVRLLIQEGDTIGGSTVRSFTVLSKVTGSPAQTRSYNNNGEVILKATDVEGGQHMLRITIP